MNPNRRKFLRTAAVSAAASGLPGLFSIRRSAPVKLRVLGTHVTLQEPIRQQAMKDLGIDISFEPGGSAYVLQKASTRPEAFDIYEQWSGSIRVLWQANAIQPIEVRLSSTVRYTKGQPFKPATRLQADSKTVLLLHLDRQLGPWAPDASPRAAHGTVRGHPRIVPSTVPSGS